MAIEWEASEVLYAMKNAGFMTIPDLAEQCNHSVEETEELLDCLGISGVLVVPPVRVCPACGNLRQTAVSRYGMCQVCRHKEATHRTEAEIQDLLATAPKDVVEFTESREVTIMSRIPPKPLRPEILPEDTPKQKRIKLAAYEAAIEDWEILKYKRIYDSARQRLKRLRDKLGIAPTNRRG